MSISTDRATGAFFLAFGVVLYIAIIPWQVESEEGTWILPATIPNAIAIILAFCGALLMLKPTDQGGENKTNFMFACLYFALLAFALFAMSFFGFVYVAPVMALVIMYLIGERRPFWLGLGVIGLPALIWILVVQLLERTLP